MPQICPRVALADRASAVFFQRPLVQGVAPGFHRHVSEACEGRAVPGVPGRHHAVEHVYACHHAVHEILRRTHAHKVARLIIRHMAVAQKIADAVHFRGRFAHRQTADGQARQIILHYPFKAAQPLVVEDAALHDAEQKLSGEIPALTFIEGLVGFHAGTKPP